MPEATDFGTFGRFEETSVRDMPPDMKEAYDFTMKLRGLVPGPHRIWLANPELSKTVVPIGAYYQTGSTLTKPEIEIATNLVNGRWLAAYSNYEHEIIGEKAGGLPPEKVEAIIAGLPTSFDDPRQQVVYELASALIAPAGGSERPLPACESAARGRRHRRRDDAARVVHRRVADPYGFRRSFERHWPGTIGFQNATLQPRRSPSASRSGQAV
jgi:4-carboxymuconolactone decarboxylase